MASKTKVAQATTDVTVYIGRFNPFHLGHVHVSRKAIESSKLVIFLLGSAGLSRSLKNPFTFAERKQMIEAWISDERLAGRIPSTCEIVVAAQRDYPYNNAMWIRSVQKNVKSIVTAVAARTNQLLTSTKIIGSDRDDSTWYLKAFPQWHTLLIDEHRPDGTGSVSATQIREFLFDPHVSTSPEEDTHTIMRKMLPVSTYSWLLQFIGSPEHTRLQRWYKQNKAYREAWEVAPHPPIFTTVDALVIQSGHILVVERGAEPGKGLWALPGGFLNQNERLRDGAIRELIEETGIRLADGKKAKEITKEILAGSIVKMEVFDAPDRSMRGRTITHTYVFRLDDTKPLPKVKGQFMPLEETGGEKIIETSRAFWITISDALENMHKWFEDHHAQIETLTGGKDDL